MENNISKLSDILSQRINSLIIRTKSLMFFGIDNDIGYGYIKTLINFSQLLDKGLLKGLINSVLYYFQAEFDESKINDYHLNVDWKNSNNNFSNDYLHILYNVLEFEYKFNLLNNKELCFISDQLKTYDNRPMNTEEKLIFNYYKAVVYYLTKNNSFCKELTLNIIIDLEDSNQPKGSFIDYLKIRNSMLYLRIIESEGNGKELMNYLEGLFETYEDNDFNDNFIIRIGLKLTDMLYLNNHYDKMFIILQKLLKILKNNKFLGKSNNIKNLLSTELCLISKISFTYTVMAKPEEAIKFIKKMEKLINYANKEDTSYEKLVKLYQYYIQIYKIINNIYVEKVVFLKSSFNYQEKYNIDDICLVNNMIQNPNDYNILEILNNLIYKLFNPNEINNNILIVMLIIYNYICILNNQLCKNNYKIDDINTISYHSKNIILYVEKHIDSMNIINLSYVKETFIKIYYYYILSYFYKKDYKKAINTADDLDWLKNKLGFNDGNMQRVYSSIIKLKGDMYFKTGEYNNAINFYKEVLGVYDKYNIRSSKRALLLFDLGLAYLLLNDNNNSREYLKLSMKNYEIINKVSNEFSEKLVYIERLIKNLNL